MRYFGIVYLFGFIVSCVAAVIGGLFLEAPIFAVFWPLNALAFITGSGDLIAISGTLGAAISGEISIILSAFVLVAKRWRQHVIAIACCSATSGGYTFWRSTQVATEMGWEPRPLIAQILISAIAFCFVAVLGIAVRAAFAPLKKG